MNKKRSKVQGARHMERLEKTTNMNRKGAKYAKKNILIVMTNTKAAARRARVFIDSDLSLQRQ